MLKRLDTLFFGTLRRQLILGVAVVHAVMMALFVWDLTERQQVMLLERQTEYATALAQSIATSSAGWLAARDFYGLQEIVRSQSRYPELLFAMTLDLGGRVVAHSDTSHLGSYLEDLPAADPGADESRVFILNHTPQLVDVIAPAILAGRQVGWVRVGLGQQTIGRRLEAITRDGILYALAAILIGSILAGIMGLRLTRRLYAIQQVTDAVKAGDVARRVQVRGLDEAAGLARAFNDMLDTLVRQRQELIDSREALAESRERFDLAMRGANDGLWDWNLKTHQVYYSGRWKAMLGYRDEELENAFSTWEALTEPTDRERTLQVIEDYLSGHRRDFEVEFRMRHKQGHWVDILSRAYLARDGQGVPLRLVGTHVDISERKRLEASLRQREAHLRTLVQTLPDLIWLKDPQGVYLSCNARFERFFGAAEEAIVGKTDHDFLDRELADSFREHDRKAMAADGPSVNEEWIGYADDGHRELLETIKTPMRDSAGKLVGVLGIGRDITERKRIETELAEHRTHLEELVETRTRELAGAKEAAEAANRAKSVFLANMSHELRTPLNAILGFAQLMSRDDRIPGDQRENLHTIDRSGQHLLALINDVLEISRIETGRAAVHAQVFDLPELLADLGESMALRARGKGLELRLEADPGLPRWLNADLAKLRQILLNLLSNAVKYTERGQVSLHAGLIAAVPDTGTHDRVTLRFEVRDSGTGIEPGELKRIFQPFYQTEYGILQGEGTGLGLAISREFAQLLGGELSAESAPGSGSLFRFVLPAQLAQPPEPAVAATRRVVRLTPGQPEFRILVAEDNPDNQRVIAELLGQVGFLVRIAGDGREAVRLFQAWRPHFIWMDMRMPEMDGYQATRAIRDLPDGRQVAIVALTASAFEEDRGDILAAGCDEVMQKPIDTERLYGLLAQYLHLSYEYERPVTDSEHQEDLSGLSLAALSTQQRAALENAAVMLDSEALRALLAPMRECDSAMADALERLITDYRFDRIVQLCHAQEDPPTLQPFIKQNLSY